MKTVVAIVTKLLQQIRVGSVVMPSGYVVINGSN